MLGSISQLTSPADRAPAADAIYIVRTRMHERLVDSCCMIVCRSAERHNERDDSAMTDGISRFRRTVPAAMRQRVTQHQQLVMFHVTCCLSRGASKQRPNASPSSAHPPLLAFSPRDSPAWRGSFAQTITTCTALYCKLLASTRHFTNRRRHDVNPRRLVQLT